MRELPIRYKQSNKEGILWYVFIYINIPAGSNSHGWKIMLFKNNVFIFLNIYVRHDSCTAMKKHLLRTKTMKSFRNKLSLNYVLIIAVINL